MQDWFSNFLVCGGDTAQDSENIDEGEYLNQKAILSYAELLINLL